MPYSTRNQLPDSVKNALSNVPHAQDIYKEAYNSAYDQYKDESDRRAGSDRESTAHAVAWNAVKNKYEKDSNGMWHPKS